MEFNITRMSSKGQVVIPVEMRKGFKEGEKLLIIKGGNKIIIEKATEIDSKLKEDMEFARRTEEGYREIEEGKYKEYSAEEFLQKIKRWSPEK